MEDKQRKNIYFASDIHLGAPALTDNREREILFTNWLEEIRSDASMIFLMGDIFDFWFEYKKVVPKGFTRTLGKLAEIVDSGVIVYFFPGNHDLWAFDYLSEELGLRIIRKETRMNLLGKNFFLAHGDGLDPFDKGYIFLKKIFTNSFFQWCFSNLHPTIGMSLAHAWSKKSRLTKMGGFPFKGEDKEGLYLYAKSIAEHENVDYFVFGHRHLLLDLQINKQAHFIILGDWINRFSYGVFDGKTFELKSYSTGESPL